jgi:hypothetical protein
MAAREPASSKFVIASSFTRVVDRWAWTPTLQRVKLCGHDKNVRGTKSVARILGLTSDLRFEGKKITLLFWHSHFIALGLLSSRAPKSLKPSFPRSEQLQILFSLRSPFHHPHSDHGKEVLRGHCGCHASRALTI